MMESLWWPQDGSDEWLSRADGIVAVGLCRHLVKERHPSKLEPVMEIGVWKGAWTSVLLRNTPVEKIVGVDPYPDLDEIKSQMLSRLHDQKIDDRFDLYNSLDQVPSTARFSLVHIDGEHSEAAVERDLTFAAGRLVDDGVIIVDDVRNFWFPGIASALYRSLEDLGLRIFASTESKAYIAQYDVADAFLEVVQQLCSDAGLPTWSSYEDAKPGIPYSNSTTVLGQRVVLVGRPTVPTSRWRLVLRRLLPPILVDMVRRMRRREP